MWYTISILSFLIQFQSYSKDWKPAQISDNDGFVLVRKEPENESSVIDTINKFDISKLSNQTKKIVKALNAAEQVEGKNMYHSGIPSKFYPYFEILKTKAGKTELIELTRHPKPVTRYYAFWALSDLRTGSDTLFDIVKNHLNDTARVHTQFGCIGGTTTVGDYMLNELRYSDHYEISREQDKEIDSLLFWVGSNSIEARNRAIGKMNRTGENYAKLKKILTEEKNAYALLPLLKYNKSEDLKFIREFISISPYYAFMAAEAFPQTLSASDFKDFQKHKPDDFSNQTWILMYKAAMKLQKDSAIEILSNIFDNPNEKYTRERHAEFLRWTLEESNNTEYTLPIKLKIANYLNNISKEFFNEVWNFDSLTFSKNIINRFQSQEHPYYDEKLINLIIDKIGSFYGDSLIYFINTGIQKGYSVTYYTCAERAKEYNNHKTIMILIDRFNNEEGKHEQDIYYRAKGVLNYDNGEVYKGIEEKVFEIIQNKMMSGFAGPTMIDLAFNCNRERAVETFLKMLETNKADVDFNKFILIKLADQNNDGINKRLIEIYETLYKINKKLHFRETFKNILTKEGLI